MANDSGAVHDPVSLHGALTTARSPSLGVNVPFMYAKGEGAAHKVGSSALGMCENAQIIAIHIAANDKYGSDLLVASSGSRCVVLAMSDVEKVVCFYFFVTDNDDLVKDVGNATF